MKPKFVSGSVLALTSLFFSMMFSSVHSANLIWDTVPGTTGAQDGNGTWSGTSTNFWDGSTNRAPVKGGDSIQFGVATTGSNTITINGGGGILNYADATSTSSFSALTINHSHAFSGATGLDGLAIGNITVNNASVVSFSSRLTGGSYTGGTSAVGRRTWVVNGSTLNLSGGGSLQNIINRGPLLSPPVTLPSEVNISGGTWTVGGFLAGGAADTAVNFGGGGTASQAAILTVNQSGTSAVTSTNFTVGGNLENNLNAGNVSTYNLIGGTLNTSLISLGSSGNDAAAQSQGIINIKGGVFNGTGEIRLGNDGGSGSFNVSGGTATNTGTMIISRLGSATKVITSSLNVSGGVSKMKQIQLGGGTYGTNSSASVNLTGGSLFLGDPATAAEATAVATAITLGTGNTNLATSVNLSGGVLGASQNLLLPATLNMTVSDANGGPAFRTADAAGNRRTFTINSNISGTGSIKTNFSPGPFQSGTLVLAGLTSTYGGGTAVSGSAALQSGDGQTGFTPAAGYSSFGTGNVTVSDYSTILDLRNNRSINDTSTLYLDVNSSLGLNFNGVETLGSIVLKTATGTVTLGPGDYSGTYFATVHSMDVNGAGTLRVVAAGYSAWSATNAGGQAANLDFDKDGVPNGIEYFFGATGSSFTANPSVVNGKITWPMSSAATGATYKVQTSTTLASGGWSDVPQGSLVVTAGTPVGSVAYTLPTSGPKLFVRLVVTIP